MFAGIFDGTVGDYASTFVSQNIVNHLFEEIQECSDTILNVESTFDNDSLINVNSKLHSALTNTFLNVDHALIENCEDRKLHYASSTGVTMLLRQNLLTIAHVGDSKACIARVDQNGCIYPEWLTVDHKPNMPDELKRIESCGGSMVYLHGNKPYIR